MNKLGVPALSCLLLIFAAPSLWAEDEAQLQQITRELPKLFEKKDWDGALKDCDKLIALKPGSIEGHYNRACCLARLEKKDEALAALAKSVELGYQDAGHIAEDPDLESLRAEQRFKDALEKSSALERAHWPPIEKGAAIPGLKTVEAAAPGGFAYRVRMSPTADAQHPNRLIVWLHPSGGAANQAAEALAPMFVKHGFGLLVITQKNFMFWSGGDGPRLQATVAEAAKIPGIKADKPVLMGFSAGGQAALSMWHEHPGSFSALIIDAAYPLDVEAYMQHRQVPLSLPKDDNLKHIPFFVLVGDKDGGSQVWKQVEPEWQKAGIPLTIRYVPNKGHAWLMAPEEAAALEKWLETVCH